MSKEDMNRAFLASEQAIKTALRIMVEGKSGAALNAVREDYSWLAEALQAATAAAMAQQREACAIAINKCYRQADGWARQSEVEAAIRNAPLASASAHQWLEQHDAEILATVSDGYHTFNELYEHRHALFSVLCKSFSGWKSKLHADGTMFEGLFIAGLLTPKGQVTYHLPLIWWDRFKCVTVDKAPEWDGHTSANVVNRVQSLVLERQFAAARLAEAKWWEHLVGDIKPDHSVDHEPDCMYCQRIAKLEAEST